jgi:hypothetical protein
MGCGATALALLTGCLPEGIAAKNGSRHYADSFMISTLLAYGFKVKRLTVSNVLRSPSSIEANNVLLLSQIFKPEEATWGVIFNSLYFHNFEIYNLEALSLLRKPMHSCYLVVHPKWRLDQMMPKESPVKLQVSEPALDLKTLGLKCKKSAVSSRP